ncbi:MAG: aldehyde dehydrogenase family protein, partial [Vicinamibacteria bacterium]
FTGSTQSGRKVMERTARRLIPTLCELGGNDPMIVLSDADIERAAGGAAWGGFTHAGQTCVSVERIYVEDSVAEAFTHLLVEKVRGHRCGVNDPGAEIEMGPLAVAPQIERVEEHLREAVEKGAKIVIGGRRMGNGSQRPSLFFEPTVVTGVDHSMKIMREETFGPVVAIMPVRDEEEAIRLANESSYGLSASVWTRDIERGRAVARRLESGTVCVNNCLITGGMPDLPFGGWKESGIGYRNFGAEGLRAFTRPRALLIDSSRRAAEPFWFPNKISSARRLDRLIGILFRW